MIKKADWLVIAKDRMAVLLLLILAGGCALLIGIVLFGLHPSDIQIPVRYTGFGQTFIYRDQWYTQYSFAGLAIIIATLNTFLAIRLYQLRRLLGLGFIGMSIFVVVLAIIVINAMFNLTHGL